MNDEDEDEANISCMRAQLGRDGDDDNDEDLYITRSLGALRAPTSR